VLVGKTVKVGLRRGEKRKGKREEEEEEEESDYDPKEAGRWSDSDGRS